MEKQDLPLFKMIVDEEDEEIGVNLISLVDDPAIGYSYQTFNKDEVKKRSQQFAIDDEEKRLVSGVLMTADSPIFRSNEEFGEHYIVFDKPTIRKIMQKFFRNNYHLQANFNHDQDEKIEEDVYFYESFMIDKERGIKAPEGFEDVPDGSWFGTMKVEDDDIWEKIKNGSFSGFSVEGMFGYGQQQDPEANQFEEMLENVNEMLDNIENHLTQQD